MHLNILLGLGLLVADSALAAPRKSVPCSTVTEYKTKKAHHGLKDIETATAKFKIHPKNPEIEDTIEDEDEDEPSLAALETSTAVVSVTDTKTKHVTKTASVTKTTLSTEVAFMMEVTTDTRTAWTTATASQNATQIVYIVNTAFETNTASSTATARRAVKYDWLRQIDLVPVDPFDNSVIRSAIAAVTKTALAADNEAPSATKTKHTATEDSGPLTTSNADENDTYEKIWAENQKKTDTGSTGGEFRISILTNPA
ncbi:hypothetical protein FSARC_6894 [Fusarium sarcochroum]|uniref:Uncharacterized protein n=1 Tax=Fusarium sarcochroum TaxID=1208366 RepID=A0A8H4TWG8_9HYPO|nr:hypothetical protein FSARC_6894 [Fusarium sarcochroum]